MTRSDGIGIGEDTLMPVCMGDSGLGLFEVLTIGSGSENLRAWVRSSGEAVLDRWVAGMKSCILVRELGRLGRRDSGLSEENLLEARETGFGLGTGGIIDDLGSREPLVFGGCLCPTALGSGNGNLAFASSWEGF